MTEDALQIIARGPRAVAEAAAAMIDETPATETLTYSILEEDEDHDVWRIDAFPTSEIERSALTDLLGGYGDLRVVTEKLADADGSLFASQRGFYEHMSEEKICRVLREHCTTGEPVEDLVTDY